VADVQVASRSRPQLQRVTIAISARSGTRRTKLTINELEDTKPQTPMRVSSRRWTREGVFARYAPRAPEPSCFDCRGRARKLSSCRRLHGQVIERLEEGNIRDVSDSAKLWRRSTRCAAGRYDWLRRYRVAVQVLLRLGFSPWLNGDRAKIGGRIGCHACGEDVGTNSLLLGRSLRSGRLACAADEHAASHCTPHPSRKTYLP
jgi:hypothetical protein